MCGHTMPTGGTERSVLQVKCLKHVACVCISATCVNCIQELITSYSLVSLQPFAISVLRLGHQASLCTAFCTQLKDYQWSSVEN